MGLVHDDVGEVRQHVAPTVVVRQHADVEHVRVGEDHVRPLAHLPATLGLGVAVVDRSAEPRQAERAERTELVLGERLRRVEVQGPGLRLAGERIQDRQVEGERLPARGAGGDDQVLAAGGRLPRLRLVGVEAVDPLSRERLAHARVQLLGQRGRASFPGRLEDEVGELLALQQLGGDVHRRACSATTCG